MNKYRGTAYKISRRERVVGIRRIRVRRRGFTQYSLLSLPVFIEPAVAPCKHTLRTWHVDQIALRTLTVPNQHAHITGFLVLIGGPILLLYERVGDTAKYAHM